MKKRLAGMEEKCLWQDYRAGNILALSNIMQSSYKDLFHWGMRLYGEKEFVKDCIQEVFLNLWKQHGTIGEVENVKGYLLMVLKSHMLRELSNKHQMLQASIDDDYTFAVEFSADLRMIEEENEIYQFRTLEKVLNTLPQRQKELIYLRFYQNLSFEEIAAVMNLGRQSAYNLFQKSLNSLRKNWPVLALMSLLFGV
ncbi:RNA polymerase sigma factor [Dyadobacter aurulentus]|uniref:RNA polymerase sigma factor n=1 Tax=Dyadobacter sp. UC 10 TaxID=2605428 RepID=UPI0011F10116|nr:sigma-70 family RNA polymerase sigma factor [Dyadobacter sp. UC 10]KAA0992149.1 sigma-70 family RNA polymerase sigma factor [Dyadobacter sp. UC 10]